MHATQTDSNISSNLSRFDKPVAVTDNDMVWGARTDELLPMWDELPEEFQKYNYNKYCSAASSMFFEGLAKSGVTVKPEFNEDEVLRHLLTILRSFQPKHEHKIAGVGYLISKWCDLPADKGKDATK